MQALIRSLLPSARTDTPLRPLRIRRGRSIHRVCLKLEMRNPTGSIKYRTALGLLAALHAQRPLTPGTTVVESTSGNLGLALARILIGLDCGLVAVVDPKVPRGMRELLVAEGAKLVLVHDRDIHGGYLLNRLAKVRELCAAAPELRWADQYNSPANPAVHRETTAVELAQQSQGEVDAVLVAVSTGGTLVGISEGLRAAVPGARVFAVDVRGSLVTSNAGHAHLLTGVGATRKSSFLRRHHYDNALRVFDIEAFAYCRMIERDTGLALGGSGGAVLAAFVSGLDGPLRGSRHPVAVIPDGGDRYRTTFYDDGWLAERDALEMVRAAEAAARAQEVSFETEDHDRDVDG
jgi:N-(2-amino-2-carboxyethyl)-L-glutamate synthase